MAAPDWTASAWLPALLVSPCIGSLLGVLAMRLPGRRPVALARSRCDGCQAVLSPLELVPIASFAVLRGRCRRCGAPIPVSHLLIELAAVAVALAAIAAGPAGDPVWLCSACLLGWSALLLAWIDWRCARLPDAITLPLLLAGLSSTWLRAPEQLGAHALACAVGYLGFRLIALCYRRLRGREGLGAGDAKLLAAGGAWLGPVALPWMVLAAALCTLAVALLSAAATGRLRAEAAVPFGPGLAASLWVLFLCG